MTLLLTPQDSVNMAQAQWLEMFAGLFSNGVMAGQLNTYTVTTTSGLGISVNTGRAMVQGFLARSDAAVPLTCATADPTNPRIDRAVLHADLSAHTLTVILLTGTPGVSPSPPTLTQTGTVWEISLYQIRVNALQTTLTGGSLTDERTYSLANLAVNRTGDTMSGVLNQTRLNSDAGTITSDGAGNLTMTTGTLTVTSPSSGFAAVNGFLPSAPPGDQRVVAARVTADTQARADLYIRSADGYGGLRGGVGSSIAAHMYAQVAGWKIDEALTVTGAITGGSLTTAGVVTAGSLSASGAVAGGSLSATGTGTVGSLTVTNAVTSVNGQASAGSFGAPVIVAQVQRANVTTTGLAAVLTTATLPEGLYRVNAYVWLGQSATEALTLRAEWTDRDALAIASAYMSTFAAGNSPLLLNASNNFSGKTQLAIQPLDIYIQATTAIVIKYNDPGGTPNDFVTVVIERLL